MNLGSSAETRQAPVVLSIAGFDPASGAGVTADIKTAAAHGCYGAGCITALTVQNTQGVQTVEPVRAELVRATLDGLAADLPIAAVRLGMLGSGEVAAAVADFLEIARLPNVVLDPVVRSSSGAELLDSEGLAVLRKRLLPLTTVVTPNLDEIAILAGIAISGLGDCQRAVGTLLDGGAKAVVVTGGHLPRPMDVVYSREQFGHETLWLRSFPSKRIDSTSTHGTGCAFATSLACSLALGLGLADAVAQAQRYVFRAIETAEPLGRGVGPIHHLWPLDRRL